MRGAKTVVLQDLMSRTAKPCGALQPPAIIPDLFIRLWTEWRNGRFNAEEAQAELDELTDYVKASTEAKPKSDFWRGMF